VGAERTKYLESLGLKVIRFENQEVIYNLDKALKDIAKHLILNLCLTLYLALTLCLNLYLTLSLSLAQSGLGGG